MPSIHRLALVTLAVFVLLVPAHSFAKEGADDSAAHGIRAQIQALLERVHLLQSHAGQGMGTTTGMRDGQVREDGEQGDMLHTASSTATSTIKALVIEPNTTYASVGSSTDVTHTYGTFTVKFDATATKQPVYLAAGDMASSSIGTQGGVTYDVTGKPSYDHLASSLTSTANRIAGGYYVINVGSTETFTLTVSIDPAASGRYSVGLRDLTYGVGTSTQVRTQHLPGKSNDFWTPRVYIPNSNSKGAAALSAVEDQIDSFMSSVRQLFSK